MDYIDMIQNSIDYIEENLDKDITLKELSERAFCSKFHYHRIFHAIMGESVMEYIRKRRLLKAAKQLMDTNREIIDIALECGFDYQQSFTRALKKHLGVTPLECRRKKDTMERLYKTSRLGYELNSPKPDCVSGPEYVYIDGLKLMGLECVSTMMVERQIEIATIPKLWKEFNARKNEITNNINPDLEYGVCVSNLPEDRIGYIASVEVSSFGEVPNEMITKVVTPSKYAKFRHLGNDERIFETFDYIFGIWLINSKHELANDIDMVLKFKERYFRDSEASQFDVFIPIKE